MVSLIRTRSLALLLSLVIPVREAVAHPRLVRTDPAAGARVAAPRALALTFNEALSAALCRVTLLDGAMKPVTLDAVKSVSGDPKTLSVVIRGSMAPGHYTVKWQVAGDDGHPMRGQYTFEVEAGATGATEHRQGAPMLLAGVTFALPLPAVASALRPWMAAAAGTVAAAARGLDSADAEFGVESPAYVLLRAIQSVAVIALLGVLALHFLVGPRLARIVPDGIAALRMAEQAAVRWLTPALALLLVATIGRLFAQQAALFGTEEMPTQASLSAILFQSLWGRAWLIAFGATIVGLVAARRLRGAGAAGWMPLAVAALALTVSMAMSGHAAAASAFAMTLHALHVIGAGGWIGSLGILMLVTVPAVLRSGEDEPHLPIAGLVRAFSPTALACAGLVAATGVAAAWRNLGSASGLWESRYGQVLLVKLALLSIAGLVGFYNWRFVLPGLGGETATGRLRRSAAVELAAAALVLVVTAVLVATPMPAGMVAAAQ
ncbi:MAG TPA: copper resistance protein CopC [Gemmatimonadaceae bacterium]|jgi:putative copper export protein/methionine-rich copper-binding protein CopC